MLGKVEGTLPMKTMVLKTKLSHRNSSQSVHKARESMLRSRLPWRNKSCTSHPSGTRKRILRSTGELKELSRSPTRNYNTTSFASSDESHYSTDEEIIDEISEREFYEKPRIYYSPEDAQHLLWELICSTVGNEKLTLLLLIFHRIQDDKNITLSQLGELNELERNFCLLQAALSNRFQLVKELINEKCNIRIQDRNGLEVIHLASLAGAVNSINVLVSHDVTLVNRLDSKHEKYTPLHCAVMGNSPSAIKCLLQAGASIETTPGLLHCAVQANAFSCVKYLIDLKVNVNEYDLNGECPIHIAACMGYTDILEYLIKNGAVVEQLTVSEMSALHLAAEGGHAACLRKLLQAGADPSLPNSRQLTALHCASQVQAAECMNILLETTMDPNVKDQDGRTALHHTATPKCRSFAGILILLQHGVRINEQDKCGCTALHIAALNELTQCVNTLLENGADFTLKNNVGTTAFSLIVRRIPSCLSTIREILDNHLSMYDPESRESEVVLKFDFHPFVPPGHCGEIDFFATLIDNGQKNILKHPLCEAFLFLKWKKLQKLIFARISLSLLFVGILTTYVINAFSHISSEEIVINNATMLNSTFLTTDEERQAKMRTLWWFLIAVTILHSIKELYIICLSNNWKIYLSYIQHWLYWLTVILICLMCPYINNNVDSPPKVCGGALTSFMSWAYLMILVGRLPFSGIYVQMFRKVLFEFAKVLLIYMFLLVGFTVSFCVLFSTTKLFESPGTGFVAVIAMMSGAFEAEPLLDSQKFHSIGNGGQVGLYVIAHVVLVLFLLLVTMVLMNLMIGLAVSDIQTLKDAAQLQRLVQITQIVSYTEMAFLSPFTKIFPVSLQKLLEKSVLLSPASYRWVFYVNPHKITEKRLPKEVIYSAYKIVKYRKRTSQNQNYTYVVPPPSRKLFKRYSSWTAGSDSETLSNQRLEKTKAITSSWLSNVRSHSTTNSKIKDLEHRAELNDKCLSELQLQMEEMRKVQEKNTDILKEILENTKHPSNKKSGQE